MNWCKILCGCFVDVIKVFKVQVFFQSFQSFFLLFFKNNDNSLSGPMCLCWGRKTTPHAVGFLGMRGRRGIFLLMYKSPVMTHRLRKTAQKSGPRASRNRWGKRIAACPLPYTYVRMIAKPRTPFTDQHYLLLQHQLRPLRAPCIW